jgi:hypothetical protein
MGWSDVLLELEMVQRGLDECCLEEVVENQVEG